MTSIGESLYQEIILDHYKHPHGNGLREPYTGESYQVNPTCGDEVTLRVHVDASPSSELAYAKLIDISYENQGCSISQASASVLYDQLVGTTVAEALSVLDEFTLLLNSRGQHESDEDLLGDGIAFAGVAKYPARVKCALLAWMAFKDALATPLSGTYSRSEPSFQPRIRTTRRESE